MNKRLVKREAIDVEFQMADGIKTYDILSGSNLRGEMIRLGVPVRDVLRVSNSVDLIRRKARGRRFAFRLAYLSPPCFACRSST